MESNKLVWCSACGKEVRKTTLQIHRHFCKAVRNKEKKILPKNLFNKNIGGTNHQPVNRFSKKPTPGIRNTEESLKLETIVCPKCSQAVDINAVEQHIEYCEYQLCDFCSSAYPIEFLDEHRHYCRVSNSQNGHQAYFSELDYENSNLLRSDTSEENLSDYRNEEDFDDEDDKLDIEEDEDSLPNIQTSSFYNNLPSWNSQQNNPVNMFFTNFSNAGSNPLITIERIQRDNNGNITRSITTIDNTNMNSNFMNHISLNTDFVNFNPQMFPDENTERIIQELYGGAEEGLNSEMIDCLPKSMYRASNVQIDEERDKCPICITELENNVVIRRLPCDHIFHPQCIDTWLGSNSHCPICKFDIRSLF